MATFGSFVAATMLGAVRILSWWPGVGEKPAPDSEAPHPPLLVAPLPAACAASCRLPSPEAAARTAVYRALCASPHCSHSGSGWMVARTPLAREHGLPPLSHWRSVLQQRTLDKRMAQSRAQLPWVRFLGMAWIWRSLGIPESVCIVCMSMRMCVHLCVWVHM